MEVVLWGLWINSILQAAEELEEAGFVMTRNPLTDNEVFQNILALSGAEWRAGNNVVPEKGPGMGRSKLHDEESYSPLQINMATWGKDTSDVDVTVINSPYVEEFQNITREDLIELITTDPKLAAKAGLIVLNSKNGYDNWTTWDAFVNNPDTPSFKEYASQFSNDPTRGLPPIEPPPESTTTTSTTVPTQEEPEVEEEKEVDTTTRSQGIVNMFGEPPQDFPPTASKFYDLVVSMMESQVNMQRKQAGLDPIAKQKRDSMRKLQDEFPVEQALRLLGGR